MFLDGLAGEVSNALNKVDGVLEARVIVQIPEKNDLSQPDKKPVPTASAFVKYRLGLEGKPPLDPEQVKRFVSTAVEDLQPANVTVIMTEARSPGSEASPDGRLQDVLSLRMTAGSAARFTTMVGLAAFLIVAMAGFSAWTFVRSGSNNRPRRRGAAD
jgi:type III secretion protein J